jgi:hypothetical protein
MIYEKWFPAIIPENWHRIAVLKSAPITAASGDVSFFATGEFEAACRSLLQFKATIPRRVTLQMDSAAAKRCDSMGK